MIKFKLFPLKKKIIVIVVPVTLLLLLITIFFIPFLYSSKIPEKQFPNVDKSKTKLITTNFLDKLWQPEYVVFNTKENGEARANFVKLHRNFLILWKVKQLGYQSVQADGSLSDPEKQESIEENLNSLSEAVEEGRLKEPEMPDLSAILENTNQGTGTMPASGSKAKELSDIQGKYKIEVFYGQTPDYKNVSINGENIPELANSFGHCFDFDSKYLYYSKYEIFKALDGISELVKESGKIYRYDLQNKTEELLYDFGQEWLNLSFKVNTNQLAYSTSEDEVGVIDVNTKEKRVFDNSKLPVALSRDQLFTEPGVLLVQIQDIGPASAILVVYEPKLNEETKVYSYRMDLNSLEITE